MNSSLGSAIRELRRLRRLTQVSLADMAGVDQSYISQIETGRRTNASWQVMAALARALEVSTDELYRRAGLIQGSVETRPRSIRERAAEWLTDLPAAIPIYEHSSAAEWKQRPVDYAYWEQGLVGGRNLLGLRVGQSTLKPDVQDSDTIFIDSKASARPGNIVLAVHRDRLIIGRVKSNRQDYIETNSESLALEAVQLEGVAIQLTRKLI